MGDEARPPCVVSDGEPAASRAVVRSCRVAAAAVRAQLVVGEEWESSPPVLGREPRTCQLGLPRGPPSQTEDSEADARFRFADFI